MGWGQRAEGVSAEGGGMTVARGSRQRELASYLLVCLSMICLLMLQLSEEREREREGVWSGLEGREWS